MTHNGAPAALRHSVRVVVVMRHSTGGPVGVLQGSTIADSVAALRTAAHGLLDRLLDRLADRLPGEDAD